jgi:hypothetical protein
MRLNYHLLAWKQRSMLQASKTNPVTGLGVSAFALESEEGTDKAKCKVNP